MTYSVIDNLRKLRSNIQMMLVRLLGRWEKINDPADQFMADLSSRHTKDAHPVSRVTLWVIAIFFIFAFLWAKYAILDEVAVGEGKVIPASQVQIIQNLEGGIVKAILVHQGQIVEKGQVLMQLDDTHFEANYEEVRMKQLSLEAAIARINAIIDNKTFNVPPELQHAPAKLIAQETELYNSQQREWEELQRSYSFVKKEYDLTKPLVAAGAASDVEILRLNRQLSDIQQQMDNFRSKALQELNTAEA